MSIVRVEESIQPLKYLVVTQEKDPESVISTNVVISDTRLNRISLINIEKGPQGDTGPPGPIGPAGKDGATFDILPVNSGGTNNTVFSSGYIIYYDGNRLSSSNYTIQDLIDNSNNNYITGIINGSGLYRELAEKTTTLGINIGDGIAINNNNQIIVDDTIVRKVELSIGNISGVVPIAKGGTNNQTYSSNRLLYYDGFKITSFPLATGRILLSGTTIDIVAGSGLVGGGSVALPSGSVVLNIGGSSDILVENNSISLSSTGTAGSYSKIVTDTKGRVVSGSNLTSSDILNILGYTPWHSGNDGIDSGLDADLLDGLQSEYFLNLSNLTGTINESSLPVQVSGGTFTKVTVSDKGIIINGLDNNYFDIVSALGYRPVSTTGDIINGSLEVNGNINLNADELTIKDNLPVIATNSNSILPSAPRGFSFIYGGFTPKTGILAFYPAERELRLITNISSTGEIVGGTGNAFMDDIDGGNADSVYVVGGLTGDLNIVLLRSMADNLYVSRLADQNISGLKTFKDGLNVDNQISIIPSLEQSAPPLNVGSNTGMVANLNVDLLHGHDSDYFNDAINMTGLFSYEKVEFDNIEGTYDYIPRFDARTSDPSRTISDSIIRQKSDDTAIIVENNANLYIGSSNSGSYLANQSMAVGINNKIYRDNSIAIGTNNIISGDNSVALNTNSKTLQDRSIAAGNYGVAWSTNQLSFGAFADFDSDSNQMIGQGQYSTIALSLNGSQTDGNWVNMSPSISLPKNKTIAYSLEVLMNKAAGTGAAFFVFDSGIIKNTTFRDPLNPSIIKNTTSILKNNTKTEIYNDSQNRRHYYHFKLDGKNSNIQNLDVSPVPLRTLTMRSQNIDDLYYYTPEFSCITGSYVKTNDGKLILNLAKPITTGWFHQASGTSSINIKVYNHGMVTGCLANISFISGYSHTPVSTQHLVTNVIDNNIFSIREDFWNGYINNNEIIIHPSSLNHINSTHSIAISGGSIYTNSPTIYNVPTNLIGVLHTGMFISYRPLDATYSYVPTQTGIITAVTESSLTLNTPFTGVSSNGYSSLSVNSILYFNHYSEYILKSINTIYTKIDGYGQQPISKITGPYISTFCEQPTIAFTVSGLLSSFSGTPIEVCPSQFNSGLLLVNTKQNHYASYTKLPTRFQKYNGVYVQRASSDGTSSLEIYNKELQPIDLPSAPFSYNMECGYGDNDNDLFSISGDYVITKSPFDYETKNLYSIRVSSTDRNSRSIQKAFQINIEDINESPFVLNPISDQYLTVDNLWTYNIPSDTFDDFDFGDSKTYSCSLANNDPLPSWLSFDSYNMTLSGTPLLANTGVVSIKLRIADTGNLTAYDIFALHINEENSNIFNYSIKSIDTQLDITNINLSNIDILENQSSGSIVGKLSTAGGYYPHLIFQSGSNSCNAVFNSGSKIISECLDTSGVYDSITLYGSANYLVSGLLLSSSINNEYQATVQKILDPIVLVGLVSSGSYIVSGLSEIPNIDYISGVRFIGDLLGWSNQARVESTGYDSLFFDIPYSGSGYDRPISISTIGKRIIVDNPYNAESESGLVIYSGLKPSDTDYYPTGLVFFENNFVSGWCPQVIERQSVKGFLTETSEYIDTPAYYVTGLVSFYTTHGINDITVSTLDDLNIEPTENSTFINYTSNSANDIPSDTTYTSISGVNVQSFMVHSTSWYPDSGIFSTGSAIINLDKNHNYKILDSQFVNQIPIQFATVSDSNSNRIPKNNLFDIVSITGNKIVVQDSKNYLLKEINAPDYFEQKINASYMTNGFSFSGTLASGKNYIYDCNSDKILDLDRNMILGSSRFANNPMPVRFNSIVSSGITFNGTIYSGIKTITCNPGLNLFENQTVFSNSTLWNNNIYITGYSNNTILLSSAINFNSSSGMNLDFYTLPVIELNQPICMSIKRTVLNNIYYNGNILYIDNLSTPKCYLNNLDQFKIVSLNSSIVFSSGVSRNIQVRGMNDAKTSITGIAMNGLQNIDPRNNTYNDPYFRNLNRFSDPIGAAINSQLPISGTISIIGSVSGYCHIPYNNNLYYNSYGGSTAQWPMDPSGNMVPYPTTGIFTIGTTNSNSSQSGVLSIIIKGFENTNFNNIPDMVNRSQIGKNTNTIPTGYIRPWGVNKKLYFDFSDGAPSLNGIYYIVDKIDEKTLTIEAPYNPQYLNASGLVYIIDNDFNIKSNANPNIDNTFITSVGSASTSPANLVHSHIDSYNSNSKRWKHLVHLTNSNIPIYSGYKLNLYNNNNSADLKQLLYMNPDQISISSIEYSLDYGYTYFSLSETDSIDIKSTDCVSSPMYIKITTADGSQKWDDSVLRSAPRINLFGISEYIIDTNTIAYNSINKTWSLIAIVYNITSNTYSRDFNIIASDETGSYSKTVSLNIEKIPKINSPFVSYAYVNGQESWSLVYDIKDLSDPYNITMSGYPGPSFNIANEIFSNSNETKIIYGDPGSITGIYHPEIYVRDYITNEVLSSHTGEIHILSLDQQAPEYQLTPTGLEDDINIDIDNAENMGSFSFYVAAKNEPEANLVISLAADPNYTVDIAPEYSTVSNRYKITVNITGSEGYFPNKNITVSISQSSLNENQELIWTRYTYNKLLNICLHKDMYISINEIIQPIEYDILDTWSVQFNVKQGILSNRNDRHPIVRLSHTPTIGTYESQPLEYNIEYNYDDINKQWHVLVSGKTDAFNRNTLNSGLVTINIYADDGKFINYQTITLLFTETEYLDNVQPLIYSVPNKSFQTTLDIKQSIVENQPTVSIPAGLTENTINISRYYAKYDRDFELWQYSYYGEPILNKWDVELTIDNINNELSDNQFSNITARCKGIATDKIYAIGKLNLIELDTFSLGGLPILITGVNQEYNVTEGSPWEITFRTVFGLENPNFPPTILLSGLPSLCSGYNPNLPLQQQGVCLDSRTWNAGNKSWNFKFVGLPLCGLEGYKPFTITAIDTDTVQNIYLSSDTAESTLVYTSLDTAGQKHPKPTIRISGNLDDQDPIQLYPQCNSSINISYLFGTTNRTLCAIPTGITGWVVSGTLPSGLEYTISFPGTLSPPWSNLSSGLFSIYGEPTQFASGTKYPEELSLTVFDARNNSKTRLFTFTDASSPNPPSPIELTVYFDSEKPKYTPRLPVGPITASGSCPLGHIDGYPNIRTHEPPAFSGSIDCTSTLPHNQCKVTSFSYSGGDFYALDPKVWIYPSRNIGLGNSSNIYVEFDNDSNNPFNNNYIVSSENSKFYITVPGQNFTTGSGRLVLENIVNFNTSDLQIFDGSLDINTTKNILGCGKFINKATIPLLQMGGYGLIGRMKPDYRAIVPISGEFPIYIGNNIPNTFLSGLNITTIENSYNTVSPPYIVKTSNCWETGYLRISGVLLPAPTIELTDPAPASEAPFAYNNQQYYIGSRCAFGSMQEDRDKVNNKRNIDINYVIKNILTNTIYQQSIASAQQAIAFNHNEGSGTVFSLFLNNTPTIFPTYKYNAIRYTENEYFWIHKGGTKNGTITQNSFPPVVIGGLKDSISCVSGQSISGYSGIMIGGYIPFNEYPTPIPYYQLDDNTNWSTINYPPIATGIVQQQLAYMGNPILLSYTHPGSTNLNNQYININIGLNPHNFTSNDSISIVFSGNPVPIPPTALILQPSNFSGSYIRIPYNRGTEGEITNGQAYVSFTTRIVGIDSNNITIQHKNIPFSTGDNIDLVLNNLSTLYNIWPSDQTSLTIASGDSSYIYAQFDGIYSSSYISGFASGSIIDIYKNYYNCINLTTPIFSKEGYWTFGLSGNPQNLYKDYIYKIFTAENSGMPIFSGTNFLPKKYSKSYTLHINKPLTIKLPENVINNGLTKTNGLWSLTFNIDGGSRPIAINSPDILLNDSLCNFNRQLSIQTMTDTYDAQTDMLVVTLSNNNDFDWRYISSFELKVFDDTGMDTKTINFS